jgi:hypothetical protein
MGVGLAAGAIERSPRRIWALFLALVAALALGCLSPRAEAATVGQQLDGMAVIHQFTGDAASTAAFAANWTAFGWANDKGYDMTTGWRPGPAYPTVDAAYYSAAQYQAAGGAAAAVTMSVNPANAGRHFSLWLDAVNGLAGAQTGYELRFTVVATNTYDVTLSKWQAGVQTVLATKTGHGFVNGNSLAIADQGGSVSAWTNTGTGFAQLLSANDSSLSSGYAGISGAGNITKLTAFKAGQLIPPAPSLDSTTPSSPADNNTPRIVGSAVAGTTVALFTNATCSGTPVTTDSAAALASPGIQVSVADNTTTSFHATATDGLGNASACSSAISYTESSSTGGMDGALDDLPVIDPFTTNETSLSGGGKWTKLPSAIHPGQVQGSGTTGGWGPYNAFPTVHGAFWNQDSFTDDGAGVAVGATLSVNPWIAERYFSLWLDMPDPANAKTGYELRFTMVGANSYDVTLSKWQAGTQTVLATTTAYSLPEQSSFALVDKGGTVSAWIDKGTGYESLLSASDASFGGGHVAVEGAGNISRMRQLKAGELPGGDDGVLDSLPIVDEFATAQNPLSSGGIWTKLEAAIHPGQVQGGGTSGGWGPYNAFPTVHGAFWNQSSTSDAGAGAAVAATLSTSPSIAERYFALWSDMPDPESAGQTGYELRFTQTAAANSYDVTLARWEAGTRTVLASKAAYTFPDQSSFALIDDGGTVTAKTDTGFGYGTLLSASDSAFDGGYAGIEGAGNITRVRDLRSGSLEGLTSPSAEPPAIPPRTASSSASASVSELSTRDFYGISSATQLGTDEEVQAMRELGLRKVRNNIVWSLFETDHGCDGTVDVPFSTATYDQVVRRAADNGITILGDLAGGRGGCPVTEFPIAGTQMYEDYVGPGGFVAKVVQRYGVGGSFWTQDYHGTDRPIRVWEVWNEPNLRVNNPGGNTPLGHTPNPPWEGVQPQRYAKFLIDVAARVRGAQSSLGTSPEAAGTKVLMGGLAPYNEAMPPDQYFSTMYGNAPSSGPGAYTPQQLHNAFDALSYHPYVLSDGTADAVRAKVQQKIEDIRAVLDTQRSALNGGSDASKRLWLTELGWPVITPGTPEYNVNEGMQRNYLKKTFRWIYNHARDYKVDYLAWYFYRDYAESCAAVSGITPTCWDKVAGLKRLDGSTRPSWCAFSFRVGTNLCAEPAEFDTATFSTVVGTVRGRPGAVSVHGNVLITNEDDEVVNDVKVNVNFSKFENGKWVYKNTAQADVVNGHYEVNNWSAGVGQWRVRAVLPAQGPYNGSESGYHEFDIESNDIPTNTFLTLDGYANGAPGTASVSGNVLRNDGTPVEGYVNVNFQKLVNGTWTTMSTAHPTLSNGHYDVDDWGVGVGQWRVRAVFPEGQGEYLTSESNYHYFDIQPVATNTFLTLDGHANGTPGTASVSGNVQRNNGAPVSGTVHVNFQKFVNGVWTTMSTAQRTLSNGHYDVVNWGVGVGQWRVRAVFPEQGDYAGSESNYHTFDIQPVPTQTFLTLDGYANGAPGTASVSGNVLRGGNGAPATGTVHVNFQKFVNGVWTTMSTAQRTLVNGHYDVDDWGVGVGQWRVRAVFPEQGDYAGSESNYHMFDIQPVATNAYLTLGEVLNGQPGYASVSGNVQRTNGAPAPGYVNVNFQKFVNGNWVTESTAHPTLSNGHYSVNYHGVGVGQWRVRAVYPQQGDYAQSESSYHDFQVKSGYRFVFRHSGRCLSLSGNNGANGTAFLQWDCSPNPVPWDGQVFTLVPLGGGYFNVKVNSTGKCVDVTGVSGADGAYLQQWDCLGAGQTNQHWQVVPIAGQPPYHAFMARHSGKCMDILGGGTGNGARAAQWGCHWGGNQQWYFQAIN